MPLPYLSDEEVARIRGRLPRNNMANLRGETGCSICKLPKDVLESVNAQIRQHLSQRKIGLQIGKHKSIVNRHANRCLPREVATKHGKTLSSFASMSPVICWPAPNGYRYMLSTKTFSSQHEISAAEADALPADKYFRLVLHYSYSPSPTTAHLPLIPQPPQNLSRAEALKLKAIMENRPLPDEPIPDVDEVLAETENVPNPLKPASLHQTDG